MTRNRFICRMGAFALLVFCGAPVWGAGTKYLLAGRPDAVTLLTPPPAVGSVESAADLDMAFRIYSTRTMADRARALDEEELNVFHFASVIGVWLVPGKFPKTEALFRAVQADAQACAVVAKKHWRRLRPYHVDPARFSDPIEREPPSDFSYPSGHATRGFVHALLLAEIFPDKRDALLAKGCDSGWLRIQGGVHFPTDVYAGRVLGQAIVHELLANPAFQSDFAEVKAELTGKRSTEVRSNTPVPR